jgi:anti-sigma factor (TIGR02949 family)
MSCDHVHDLISSFLDGAVPAEEREMMSAHFRSCRECGARLEFEQNLRSALRTMDHAPVPAALSANLRVLASHERARQQSRVSFPARVKAWRSYARLAFDNMMRPFAVPVAGGVLSALIAFGTLVPTLTFQHAFADQSLFTDPDGEVVALGSNGYLAQSVTDIPRIVRGDDADIPADANVVDLVIDENGRVSDWSLARGQLTPDLQSIIMFSQFKPATYLGLPTWGRVKAIQSPSTPSPRRIRS